MTFNELLTATQAWMIAFPCGWLVGLLMGYRLGMKKHRSS